MNWRVKIIRAGIQFEMWFRAPTRIEVMRIIESVSSRQPEEPIQIVSIREDNLSDHTD